MFFQNVGNHLQDYTVSQPRRHITFFVLFVLNVADFFIPSTYSAITGTEFLNTCSNYPTVSELDIAVL
jgi:hypothetical protein